MKRLNKKGGAFMTLLIAVVFFMFGVLIIGLLFPLISGTRGDLSCSDNTISSGNKLTCLGIDMLVPAFVISLVLIGGGYFLEKLLSS